MRRIAVIAGNAEQAAAWAKAEGFSPKDYTYVHKLYQLFGLRDTDVICTGLFWENPIWDEEQRVLELIRRAEM